MNLSPHILNGAVAHATCFQTTAKECKPLVLSRAACRTLKSKHLLLVSEEKSACIVFAVEIYVYLLIWEDKLERQLFVSKADTTGLGETRISIAGVVGEFIRHVLSIPILSYIEGAKWRPENSIADGNDGKDNENKESASKNLSEFELVNTLNELSEKLVSDPSFYNSILFYSKRAVHEAEASQKPPIAIPLEFLTKICLFTRSADSYIFPYSQKNSGKHIANGNALFKWWINVLNETLDDTWNCKADIPGSDVRAVERFLPASSNWSTGSIYSETSPNEKAVYTIPLFPDDPKGRFLEHLIVENRYKSMNTKQFWDELGFRQEFRLGNVVGILSCVQNETRAVSDESTSPDTIISPKDYKKLIELIKSEDFSKKDDVQAFVKTTLPGFFSKAGIKLTPIAFTGTKALPPKPVNSPKVNSVQVNTLNGMKVKRINPTQVQAGPKRAEVNNLTQLVKRKKT